MAEKKQVIDIEAPKNNELLDLAVSGPSSVGGNLFSKREGAISEGLKFTSAIMIRALMQASQLAGSPKNNVAGFSSPNFTANLPEVDELAGAKELFKDIAASHDYAQKNYKGENLSSLFKKFAETKDPQDFDRFIDYTTNQVAQQIPQQAILWGGQAVGVPAPLTLSLLGASSAGQSYLEDKEQAPQLTDSQMRQRAAISGASEVATEGLSLGLKGAAMAGKSALEAIPGVKQAMAKGLASSSAKLFQKMSNALGGGPARRIFSNAVINSFGEGGEEMANQAVQIMSDEAYGVRFYTLAEKIDSMIEVFGISAIASGLVGSPMITAVEIQRAVDTQKFIDIEKQAKPMMENLQERSDSEVNTLPSPEELFTISHIIKRYKNGLPNSRNMDNSIHIVSADVIALEALVDSMIQNKQWNDTQMQSKLGMIGEEIKKQMFDERGFVRMGDNKEFFSYLEEVVKTKLPNRATPDQILRTLEGQGVPLEEVQDMGLVEWLQGKETVTKKELIDYLEGNDNIQNKAVAEYSEGSSLREVSKKYNVDHKTIERWVKKLGVEKRQYRKDSVLKSEAVRLYKDGKSQASVANELGVSQASVGNWIKEFGEKARDRYYDNALKQEVVRLYSEELLSAQDISDKLDIPAVSVTAIVKSAGANRTRSEAAAERIISKPRENYRGKSAPYFSEKNNAWSFADSRLELARMAQLDEDLTVESWTKKTKRIPYGEGKSYVPDFLIKYKNGETFIEEVKPSHLVGEDLVQVKKAATEKLIIGSNVKYRIVTEDDIGRQAYKKALAETPAMRKAIMKGQAVYGSKSLGAEGLAEPAADFQSEFAFDESLKNLPKESEVAYDNKEESFAKVVAEIQAKFTPQNVERAKIVSELRAVKYVDYTGRKISGVDELAQLHQVFRSPAIESFVYYVVTPDGTIHTNKAMTGGDTTEVRIGQDVYDNMYQDLVNSGKGSKLYIAHNHPSGTMRASAEDIALTQKIRLMFPSAYAGHIIIDHGNFVFLDENISSSIREYKVDAGKDWLEKRGIAIREPESLAGFFSDAMRGARHLHIPFVDRGNNLIAYEIFNPFSLGDKLFRAIKEKIAAYAATGYVVMGDQSTVKQILESSVLPTGVLDVLAIGKNQILSMRERNLPEAKTTRGDASVFEPESKYSKQSESVKQSYNRIELSKAIGEVQAEIREIISQERDVLEDYASEFRGGEVIRNEEGGGYRTSLPALVKHPKTGNKPINNKQWRELAVHNLERGKSVTGEHENYRNLLKQKKEFISRLADIEMQAASDEINVRTQNTSEELKAFTQQEKEWFRETTKQTEIFDDVPPTNLNEIEMILGSMEPAELKDIFSGTMYTRDFYRNFEKVFGKNLPAIDKYILKPLDESMLESIKFSERMVNELKSEIVNKLGIKKKSKMSQAVQLYGEGRFDPEEGRYFKISDEELAAMVGKENVEKVKIAEKWFREKYETLLTRVNAVISKIYPGNKDKIIPKRNNYFRHFSELSEFRGLINIFDNPANISSDLAGSSMFTKPKMKWLSFAQQRLGWRTDIDAVGGFLNYLPAAAHAIYVDPNIPKIRALEKALRVATHDTKNLNNFIEFLMMYANELAGKTGVVDRLPLQLVGRKGIRAIDWVSRRVKSNLILFSLGSAISQAFNLPQAIAKTKVYFVPGTQDYMKSIFTKDGPHKKSIFLPTRYGNDIYFAFNADIMNKPKEAARWIMTALDHVSTHMMWYSFYDQAIGQKMDDPIRYADTETRKMVAGRSTHEVPLLYKSKVMQATAPFTLEMSNLWWALGDDLKEKDFVGLVLFSIAAWLMNSGAELIRGYRVMFDPIDMLVQAFSGDKTIPQRVGRVLGEISSNVPFGKQVQGLYPMYGWKVSDGYKMPTRQQFFGENDQTRFGNAIVAMSAVTDPIFSFVFPYGGRQVKKTLDAVSVLQKGSVPAGKSEIKFKQTIPTTVKALAFGKGSIPEVREYYKAKNEKKANPTGEDRRKKSKSYGGSYGKSRGKYGGSYGK